MAAGSRHSATRAQESNNAVDIAALLNQVRACSACAKSLPHAPRPVVQLSAGARLLIIGQAPGSRVHASGIAWDDDSGARLRAWTGIDNGTFHDPTRVAMMPMGFCYPGKGEGADLPPRPECAPLWHDRVLAHLPRRRLTLLVGMHAQRRYLRGRYPNGIHAHSMTAAVRQFSTYLPDYFPLPHPSWRSTLWMRRNPWFAEEVLPALRAAVRATLR
jgi:uracil-DNA glycosylase